MFQYSAGGYKCIRSRLPRLEEAIAVRDGGVPLVAFGLFTLLCPLVRTIEKAALKDVLFL